MDFELISHGERITPKNVGDVFIAGTNVNMLVADFSDNTYRAVCIGNLNGITSYVGRMHLLNHDYDIIDGRFVIEFREPIKIQFKTVI